MSYLELLKLAAPESVSSEQARSAWAVRVLEYIETAESRMLLKTLATNRRDAQLASEADLALKRLSLCKK